MPSAPEHLDRLISLRAVCDRCGISRTTVWRLMRAGQFPPSTAIGARALWSEHEIQHWIADRLDARDLSATIENTRVLRQVS